MRATAAQRVQPSPWLFTPLALQMPSSHEAAQCAGARVVPLSNGTALSLGVIPQHVSGFPVCPPNGKLFSRKKGYQNTNPPCTLAYWMHATCHTEFFGLCARHWAFVSSASPLHPRLYANARKLGKARTPSCSCIIERLVVGILRRWATLPAQAASHTIKIVEGCIGQPVATGHPLRTPTLPRS